MTAAALRAVRRIGRIPFPILLGLALALAVMGGLGVKNLLTQPISIPFPVPVYSIEAKSGTCNASIANLNIGYVGTLQAPVPVDVNCDLIPDVTVAVNLIDLEGPLNDPLANDSDSYQDFLNDRAGRTIAPNVEINRYPLDALSIILNKPSPPVRINVKLTVKDLEFQEPDTILRFGYETGEGGSIPTHFKTVLRGLQDFYNPLEAVIDTKGDFQGADTVPSYYEGPLTLIGGVSTSDGQLDAKLDVNYSPFPDVVKLGYASDDDGHHIDYAHGVGEQILLGYGTALPDGTFEHYVPGELPEVDMSTKLDVVSGGGDTLNLTADVDRLPRRINLDINTPENQGRLDYEASTDGRLPDARVNLRSVTDGELTRAQAHVEEIPPELHALWTLGNDDDISALFTTSDPDAPGFDLDTIGAGPGIGAIEVLYSNVDTPSAFTPFVATEQQFLNLQALGGEQLVSGRIEDIRGISFDTRSDGFDVVSRVGDGALPLETNIQMDGLPETGDALNAAATITPLPSSIDVNLFSGDKTDPTKPFKIVYDANRTVDVDATAELREPTAAAAACGEPGTVCADLGIRHLPAHMEVAIAENGQIGAGSTTNVAIDSVPRPGAPKPDIHIDAILGKLDSVADPGAVADAGPVILEASGVLRGIPETVRLRFVEGADETLERLDVATCELDVTDKCPAGTDPIERVDVQIRNFRDSERADANVPHPAAVAPQFATLTARGSDNPAKTADPTVRFEVASRVRDITEVRYANVNGLFGVRSVVGDNRDLEVLLDVENVIFEGNDPKTGPVDLKGRALVRPLPAEIDLCLREEGFPLTLADSATFTDICESTNPLGDGSATDTPLTFAYDASSGFDVDASVDLKERGLAAGPADDHDIHGALVLDNVPSDLTAHIQMPPERPEGAPPPTEPERLRIRANAPGATNTNLDFEFEDRFAGATCADPQPAGDITCAAGTVTGLPEWTSVVADTGPDDATKARVFACDLVIATNLCRTGTDGLITETTARLRMVAGNPVEEGDLVPFVFAEHPYRQAATPATAYTLALRLDQDDTDNKELKAEARLAQFRSLSFDRSAAGFDIRTDLGDGKTPLLGSVAIDTRVPASAPPPPPGEDPATGKLIVADTRVDPLPQVITISQHGPGDNQQTDPLEISYDSTAPVDVDARAQIFDQVAGELCGDHGTMCASLALDRLPTTITAAISTFDEGVPETPETTDVRRRMHVDLDAIPFGTVAAPDLTMDAAIGATPEGDPPFDDTPIVAHAELHGFSEKARIRLAQTGTLLADESLEDAAFEEALFVTCELAEGVSPPECDGPEFPVQEIAIAARNFHYRPTDFPVPRRNDVPDRNETTPLLSDPMYAEAVARGDQFEAHAGFTNVREFRMRNVDDVIGVKVGGGDGQAFEAHGDLAGIVLPDEPLGDAPEDGVEERTLSVDATATLSNVPTEFAFCMRSAGAPLKPLTGDFTEPCEEHHPFADPFFDAVAPESGPLSIAYRANAEITQLTTTATAEIIRREVVPGPMGIPDITPLPTFHVFGDVTIDHLPQNLTVHLEMPPEKKDDVVPVEEGGPIRALFFYDEPPSAAPINPVDITFEAEYTLGDAVCKDLRQDQTAFCFSGKLENLPARVKAFVDPEAPLVEPGQTDLVQNLRIETSNTDPTQKMNLRNIKVSVVKQDDDPTKPPLVLVIDGDNDGGSILGLPSRVDGTIHMADEDPAAFDKPAFDIVASPPLDEVDLEVRNFVGADPLPEVAPPRNGATVDQSITFLQRGDFFKAIAKIEDVAGGGYKTGRNAAGQATETQLIRVDFGIPDAGPKPTIRGYVDLLTVDDLGNPTHVFADILLDDVPHGIDVCFRGEPPDVPTHDLTPAPGTEEFCDTVDPELGAFRFQGRTTGDPEPELDVSAIFRMTSGSDTNVLKAVADVRNIPNVIEGTFGDGAVAVNAFKANGTTPAGIDDVVAEMADFDFEDDGYAAGSSPWGFDVPGTVILPAAQPGPAHEFARVASNGTDFHVKAHIGTAHDGSEGARITSFQLQPEHCAQPAGAESYFPHYPNDPANEYKCIRADLEAHSAHPLLLDADLVLDGTPLKILNAGLTQLPKYFQVTVAKTPTMAEQNGVPDALRRRCGTAQVEPDNATDCMPPLIHFDSEGNSQLFGQLYLGNSTDLQQLKDTAPGRTMADLEEEPAPPAVRDFDVPPNDPDNWSEFPDGLGVRAKIGKFPADRVAVRAGFRLNLPKALTVDQVQKWEKKVAPPPSDQWREGSDLKFHYVMRDSSGIVPSAGELVAMVHEFSDGGQILVSKIDNDLGGIPIPGEFGLDFYDRDFKGKGRRLIQVDLRTSVDLAARVRLVAGTGAKLGDSDFKLTGVKGVPYSDPGYQADPTKPSFRLRAELKDPADVFPAPAPDTGDWKDDLLCVVWCIGTNVGAPQLTAELDLAPTSTPVRMLEAVVNMVSDTKLGAQIRSYANIEGTAFADFASDHGASGFDPFATGGIHVDIDPFDFFLHAGVPILASFDLLMVGQMNVDLNIGTTNDFRLRMDTTELKTMSTGAEITFDDLGSDTWLQLSEAPGVLAGYASLFWPFPPVYLWYAMGLAPAIPFNFHVCPTPGFVNPIKPFSLPILPTEVTSTAFLPFVGPFPIARTGPLLPILDPLFILGGPPIMCAIFDAGGTPLFSEPYLPPSHTGDRSPGDPMVEPGHSIPGLGISAAPVITVPTPPGPPAPIPLNVTSGTKTLCGTHAFSQITVAAAAAINVGTVAFDDPATPGYVECPPNVPDNPDTPEVDPVINLGKLHLTALKTSGVADSGQFTINGTVNGPTGGSLMLVGENLTVSGTGLVNVDTGMVELFAADELHVDGTVEADSIATSMPTRSDNSAPWATLSTGNAGASHGGTGGSGTGAGGSVGAAYGSGVVVDNIPPGTETGTPGASPDGDTSGGRGGGFVTLRGSEVFISGTVHANAEAGESDSSGDCSVPDDPDVDGDQSEPNTGQAGAGGGSGGGIAVHGVTLDVTGLIQARGGAGGSGKGGAGGGGGGGVIRLNAGDVDTDADAIDVGKGLKGSSSCPDDFDDGSDGHDGVVDNPETPRSHAIPTNQPWYNPDRLTVPYKAASAALTGPFGSDDFVVYLCGIKRGPEAVLEGFDFGPQMPQGEQPSADNHCGTKDGPQGPESSPQELGVVTHSNTERAITGFELDPSATLDPGVWGLWTVAAHPEVPDFLCGFFLFSCTFEDNPDAPEVVVRIDNFDPRIAFSPVGTTTNADGEAVTGSNDLSVHIDSVLEELQRSDGLGPVPLSGVDLYRCYTGEPLAEVGCDDDDGRVSLTLPGGEGTHTVYVVAFDMAGNSSAPLVGGVPDVARFDDATVDEFDDDRVTVIVDRTAPGPGAGAITIPASPTGENGWYTDPPTQYLINGFDDGAGGSGEHAEGGFRYRFDGADWAPCFDPCALQFPPTVLPGAGSHTLYWKAIDGAGLESAESSLSILVDGTAPQTAVSSIPEFEAGVWITAAHPMVVARGVDEFGGSSVGADTGDDLCDGNPATGPGKSGTCISLTGVAGPYVNYLSVMDPDTGAVELDSGTDQVICAYSVDVAGNEEAPALAANCTDPLDIDNDDPTGSISIVPPGPTGDNGWYDGSGPVPTINLFNYNGTGSPEPAGGGFRYRVDNSFERSCANPCVVDPLLLGEGSHNLHWTVVDTAGNRRPEQTVNLLIDIDDPRAHILVEGPSPNGANGWYVNRPVVTLVPFDEPLGSIALRPIGSGPDAVNYTLDGNPFVYNGPFSVGPGDHNLCVSASDTAGNEEGPHCQRVAVDLANPTTSVLQNGSLVPVNDGDNGWYRLNAVNITQTSSDPAPGSGVAPQSLSAGLCDHIPDADPAPAGVCISVDGRAPGATIGGPEFGPYTGAILLGEGEHVIRSFSVDNAGRRSAMDREVVLVDRSDPVSVGRLRAPEPSRVGALRPWWRHQPTLVLRAIDGDQNAGVRSIQYRFDGAGTIFTYTTPPTMPVGIHFVEHRAIDESGRVGPWRRINVAVDIKPPVVKALSPNPALWLYVKLLNLVVFGPEKNKLQWQISDDLSSQVRVRVIVYNELGLAVRHLDGGVHTVTPGVTKSGFTEWDGKDDSLIGFVPAGIYYYRVVAIDDAGNPAMSGESTKLAIKLKLVL